MSCVQRLPLKLAEELVSLSADICTTKTQAEESTNYGQRFAGCRTRKYILCGPGCLFYRLMSYYLHEAKVGINPKTEMMLGMGVNFNVFSKLSLKKTLL